MKDDYEWLTSTVYIYNKDNYAGNGLTTAEIIENCTLVENYKYGHSATACYEIQLWMS